MKAGLLINPSHPDKINTNEKAVDFFKLNSTFSILTNSSTAAITFLATLNDGVTSPFIQTRSNIFGTEIKTLLFKYFPIRPAEPGKSSSETNNILSFYTHQLRGNKTNIELTEVEDIEDEYKIQLQIYEITYNTLLSANEPVCPYPISCSVQLDKKQAIQEIITLLDETNKEKKVIITDTLCGNLDELIKGHEKDKDTSYISTYNKKTRQETQYTASRGAEARAMITNLACIVMEHMDKYITLEEYKKTATALDKDIKKAESLAAYELVRLKEIGFIHGDLIPQNMMYNSEYKYITTDDKNKGRVILIDFGRSLINKELLIREEKAWINQQPEFQAKYQSRKIIYERKDYLSFHFPNTFRDIFEGRLEATLNFRTKKIEQLEDFFDKYSAVTSNPEGKKQLLERSLIMLKKINDFIYPFLYPTINFINEEFTDYFNEDITPLVQSKFTDIRLLEQRANDVYTKLKTLKEIVHLLPTPPQPLSKKISDDDLPYNLGLVDLLKLLISRRKQRKQIKAQELRRQFEESCSQDSSQGSQSSSQGGRLVKYDKKHKVYNKHFPYSLHVNQYNGRIRNTLNIKYIQSKKSKNKKSKNKKNKSKKVNAKKVKTKKIKAKK
jgi:hypothetical protein